MLLARLTIFRTADGTTDLDFIWFAARALRDGQNPYLLIGPGRAFDRGFELPYPATTLVAFLPLSWLSLNAARVAFVAGSAALLAYGLTRRSLALLPVFLSASFLDCVRAAQWAPLLTASALLPGLAWLYAVKPNLGLAFALAFPSRRALVTAAAGGAVLASVGLLLLPSWPRDWLGTVGRAGHFQMPVAHLGGPLLLLALLRWRQPEARLLLCLACIPQTPSIYETLPLFLVARRRIEALWLVIFSHAARFTHYFLAESYTGSGVEGIREMMCWAVDVEVALLYLPALVMVLRRPNEGDSPAWLEAALGRMPTRRAEAT